MTIERGRVAIVTGSTSGIGREIARRLTGEGARVVVTGRDEDRGREVVEEIADAGGEAIFVAHNLEEANAGRLVEEAVSAFRRVDILARRSDGWTSSSTTGAPSWPYRPPRWTSRPSIGRSGST